MCERCACFKLERMNKEEIEKQIEAVRGLIDVHEYIMRELDYGEPDEQLEAFTENLSTLTQTLQPYLNGEKLEV